MKRYAVIVAGGSGTRMQSQLPKQFISLHGRPVLYYTIAAFLKAFEDIHIILVLPEDHLGTGQEIIDAYFDYERIELTPGGRTRFHSVQNGLKLVEGEGIVFVHDAVRCLVSDALIQRCEADARQYGSAIPVIESKDSVRLETADNNEPVDRSRVKLVQTPQTFHSGIILPAFANIDYKEKFTDEATVVEAFGMKVHLTQGEDKNIKITLPTDLLIAEYLLERSGLSA